VSIKVQAFNNSQTADSAAVSVTLPNSGGSTTLAAPQLTVTAISSTRALLKWTAVSGAEGYRIYRWNGVRAVLLGTVGATATSARVSRLRPGSTNQFLVEAYAGSQVADSSWVSITMPARTFTGSTSNRKWSA
jgi:fibronectin type III domain protein